MALPALGVVAKFVMSSGTGAAIRKYGQSAVTKAAKEIKKFDSELTKKASAKTRSEGYSGVKNKELEQIARRKGMDTRLNRNRAGKDFKETKIEVPLKFAKGGSIDGKAVRGLTKVLRRK
tara:strand:+ start:733 stop:1092 length:360 start_codon:yes stop_codon:yes gene_type:complete